MKRFIIITFSFLAYFISNAQIPGAPKNLLSPNATSLGLYGEIPVSMYTGTPNISIPIYDLTYGDITIPISLSYHASGIRPDQHPGWVGLGWTLNAGGMISRTVKDLPDEYNNEKRSGYIPAAHSLFNLGTSGYLFKNPLQGADWSSNLVTKIIDTSMEACDTEPDEFSFNFLNYSGKFYLNKDGEWEVECDKPVKVTFLYDFTAPPINSLSTLSSEYRAGNTQSFKSFQITDEYGIIYIFGDSENAIEFSIDFFNQNASEWVASSWMLKEIEYPNGMRINFEYDRGDLVNQMYVSANSNLTSVDSPDWEYSETSCESNTDIVSSVTGASIYKGVDCIGGMLIAPVYLKQISTPSMKINFLHSYTKELRYNDEIYEMKAYKYSNSYKEFIDLGNYGEGYKRWDYFLPFVEKWNLSTKNSDPNVYVYKDYISYLQNLQWQKLDLINIQDANNNDIKSFRLKYSNKATQRLTLGEVVEYGSDLSTKGKVYSFEYYNMDKLPPYLSLKTDHWGFFNDVFSQVELGSNNYLNSKNANGNVANYGSLRSITYPTGGVTEFIYEPHDYKFQLKLRRWEGVDTYQYNKVAGGIRIKSIISYPEGMKKPEIKYKKDYYYVNHYPSGANTNNNSSGVLGGQIKYNYTLEIPTYSFTDELYVNKTIYSTITNQLFSYQSVLPCSENSSGSHIGYNVVTEVNSDGSYTTNTFSNFNSKMINSEYDNYYDDIYKVAINGCYSPYSPYISNALKRGKLLSTKSYDYEGNLVQDRELSYIAINENENVRTLNLKLIKVCGTGLLADGTASTISTISFLPEKEVTKTFENGQEISTEKKYYYNSNRQLIKEEMINSDKSLFATKYKYIGDVGDVLSSDEYMKPFKYMKINHMIGYPIETTTYIKRVNGTELVTKSILNLYKKFPANPDSNKDQYKLSKEFSLDIKEATTDFSEINLNSSTLSIDSKYKEKVSYNTYDWDGRPLFVTKNGVENYVYLWSYNHQYPILEAKNCTWSDILTQISEEEIALIGEKNIPESADWDKMDNIQKNLTNSLVSIYCYKPHVGITKTISPNQTIMYYDYDLLGRLKNVSQGINSQIRTLKSFEYKTSNY